MGVSAQHLHLRQRCQVCSRVVALLLALLIFAPGTALPLESQSWRLQDQSGRGWLLTLLEQADPAYPAGCRLRLTDRSGTQVLDHNLPLRLRDGLGNEWELENRSIELVPADNAALPAGSAQFNLSHLEPQPRSELPLLLVVSLASGDPALLMALPEAVEALHQASGL